MLQELPGHPGGDNIIHTKPYISEWENDSHQDPDNEVQ